MHHQILQCWFQITIRNLVTKNWGFWQLVFLSIWCFSEIGVSQNWCFWKLVSIIGAGKSGFQNLVLTISWLEIGVQYWAFENRVPSVTIGNQIWTTQNRYPKLETKIGLWLRIYEFASILTRVLAFQIWNGPNFSPKLVFIEIGNKKTGMNLRTCLDFGANCENYKSTRL